MGDNRPSAQDFELSDDEREEHTQSDVDSLFSEHDIDIESPVDGFFRSQAQSAPIFVQNSFVQAESESKAQEAAREQAATGEGPSHFAGLQYRPQAPGNSHWQPPPQQNNDIAPPPDYQTAISDRSSQQESSRVTSPTSDQASPNPRQYGTITRSSVPNLPNLPNLSGLPNLQNFPQLPFLQGNDNERQWPFGNRDNPFSNPNFPFAAPQEPQPQPKPQPRSNQPAFASSHPLVRNGLLGEHGSFLPRTEPESMTDYRRHTESNPVSNTFYQPREHRRRSNAPVDEQSQLLPHSQEARESRPNYDFDNTFTWRGPRRSSIFKGRKGWLSSCWCSKWAKWFVVVGVTVFLVLMASASYSATRRTEDNKVSDGTDSSFRDKPKGYPGGSHKCYAEGMSEVSASISFSKLKSFSLLELLEHKPDGPSRITGWIEIQPGTESQENDLDMSLHVGVSKGWEVEELYYTTDERGIEVEYPRLKRTSYEKGGCMSLGIVLRVRPGLELSDFAIDTVNCAIHALDGLFDNSSRSIDFQVHGKTTFSTTSGDIAAEYWSSRKTVIDSSSGQVLGTYELLDVLDVRSSSGQVKVQVLPGQKDGNEPKPAELFVRTNSGSISVKMPTEGPIPDRDYQTTIESSSGTIIGSYILGSFGTFSSNSGALRLEILPFDSNVQKFYTRTASGEHRINVLSPSRSSATTSSSDIAQLQSSHKSFSGSLTVVYPDEWTGKIDAQSLSGSINLSGNGIERTSSLYYNHVIAHKGEGNSLSTLRSTSGSIGLTVGTVR